MLKTIILFASSVDEYPDTTYYAVQVEKAMSVVVYGYNSSTWERWKEENH